MKLGPRVRKMIRERSTMDTFRGPYVGRIPFRHGSVFLPPFYFRVIACAYPFTVAAIGTPPRLTAPLRG